MGAARKFHLIHSNSIQSTPAHIVCICAWSGKPMGTLHRSCSTAAGNNLGKAISVGSFFRRSPADYILSRIVLYFRQEQGPVRTNIAMDAPFPY
jgi:hypothetical protein